MAEIIREEPVNPNTVYVRDEPVAGTTYVRDDHVARRGGLGLGSILALLLALLVLVAAVLFATGFWSAKVKDGSLPTVSVNGGSMPAVAVESKKVVVGTKTETINTPKVEMGKTDVKVPVIGVQDPQKTN